MTHAFGEPFVFADGEVPRIFRKNKDHISKLALYAGLLRIKLRILIEIGIEWSGEELGRVGVEMKPVLDSVMAACNADALL
jgi:hypothetical protein